MAESLIQLNEVITLDLTINAIEKPKGANSMSSTRSSFSSGGGRGGRGSGGYNKINSGVYDQSGLFEKVNFKQKIKLVKQ